MKNHRLHRFKPQITQIFLIYSVLSLFVPAVYAETISSTELIESSQEYDGKEIVYEGEVIGELMHRKDGVWANVVDGENAIGVWMSSDLASEIEYKGTYNAQGDILQIIGILNRACVQHGGDFDIHASSINKIKSGWIKQDNIVPAKRALIITLAGILCLVLILRILIIK